MMGGMVALLDETAFMMDGNAGVANESDLILGGAGLVTRDVISGEGGVIQDAAAVVLGEPKVVT